MKLFLYAPLKVNLALARMYGYESSKQLMQSLQDIAHQLYVHPHRREEFVAHIEEHGAIVDFESQVYRKDGQVIWISETVRSVRDVLGELMLYEGVIREIAEK